MSPSPDALRALMAGEPGAVNALLPACRAYGFGAEAFGAQAVAELFLRWPSPLSPEPHLVETAAALAVGDADLQGREQAIVAELYDGRIGRLWRIGWLDPEREPDPALEPALNVAFDPFLSQRREAMPLEPSAFPELPPPALPALSTVGRHVLTGAGVSGERALTLRAFGRDGRAAALFAIHSNTGAVARDVHTTLATATFRYGSAGELLHHRIVLDATPPPSRLVRLVGLQA